MLLILIFLSQNQMILVVNLACDRHEATLDFYA